MHTHPSFRQYDDAKLTGCDMWLSKVSTTTNEAVCDPLLRVGVTFS
jgi:hypothetical protein